MVLINLSHPLTDEQRARIEHLTRQPVARLIERMPHFDETQSLAEQTTALIDDLGLTAEEWQQASLLVLLPALNFAAATVLAELHGRCGYFPPMVRVRPVAESLPPRYEVAEVVNLQALRDAARKRR
jgi:hypothetical protein